MIFSTLDTITRRTLLERSLPIHYYFERLLHHSTAIRELSFDTLKIVNTLLLPINASDYTIDLPSDCVDVVAVSPPGGQLKPLPQNDDLTSIRYHDTSGNFAPPPFPDLNKNGTTIFGYLGSWYNWYWNINDYGESTGRYFGARGASDYNGYKVIKERRQIQLPRSMNCGSLAVMYISDGQRVDNATQVDVEAISCIQSFGDWQASPNATNPFSPEAKRFDSQKRLLRARLDDLTNTDVIHIIRKSYTAAMKS